MFALNTGMISFLSSETHIAKEMAHRIAKKRRMTPRHDHHDGVNIQKY
jgi:hypothetical protein